MPGGANGLKQSGLFVVHHPGGELFGAVPLPLDTLPM